MTSEEIVKALRICATHKDKGCGLCPQRKYVRCTERLADEAITMIERLTAENADLRKEIEWKDMVIALAQRKQTEAEAERDALREQLPCWIPVMERRPERGGKYLCVYSFRTMDDSPVRMSFPSVLDYYATDPVPHFQHEGVNEMHVTHWMPLPEAPEEGDKA